MKQPVSLPPLRNKTRALAGWPLVVLCSLACLQSASLADVTPTSTSAIDKNSTLPATAPGSIEAAIDGDDQTSPAQPNPSWDESLWEQSSRWTTPAGLTNSIQVMLMLSVLSLAPAILLMTTCFVRVVVVLGILRQALGTAQLPPTQVLTSLAVFISLLVMSPVWKEVHETAIQPYSEKTIDGQEAWRRGKRPLVHFMGKQIDMAGNTDDVWLFYDYLPANSTSLADQQELPETYDEIPIQVLLPAYVLSELKTAFLIGFQIFLPFLVLDLVVASVTISMGMLMVPPAMISLPFKLLLFVLVDGWHLVVGMLMQSLT